jgi:hypothetical protein
LAYIFGIGTNTINRDYDASIVQKKNVSFEPSSTAAIIEQQPIVQKKNVSFEPSSTAAIIEQPKKKVHFAPRAEVRRFNIDTNKIIGDYERAT